MKTKTNVGKHVVSGAYGRCEVIDESDHQLKVRLPNGLETWLSKAGNIHYAEGVETYVPLETVGRKFKTTRYGVHSRRADSNKDAAWYGTTRCKTLDEAREYIEKSGARYLDVGGLTIDTGRADTLFEFRIVKQECEVEVVAVEMRRV